MLVGNMAHPGGEGVAEEAMFGETSHDTGGFTTQELYQILSNKRRRYVIHYLQQNGGCTDISSLAECVAAWENGSDVSKLTAAERKNAYTALHQRHLPKLDEADIVEFNKSRGVVEPTPELKDITIYTEVVGKRGIPWSLYYLGLAGVSFVLTIGIWANALPFLGPPNIAGGVFCSIALAVSALVHHYVMRQARLGTNERPPEISKNL